MTQKYTFRQYVPGDESTINALYYSITGRTRTIEQFHWQWQNAPGGEGDIWLIEANLKGSETKLIGHHGIMPIRFTYKSDDLLFGKTENTMVLPEYRKKILYTRFEQRFLANYSPRFHSLFSTTGPSAAIRQRIALGYEPSAIWQSYRLGIARFSTFQGSVSILQKRIFNSTPSAKAIASAHFQKYLNNSAPSNSLFMLDQEASEHDFFDNFWNDARGNYGVAPRRDKEDLRWRFWMNPHIQCLTFINNVSSGDRGYAIISFSSGSASLEDWAVINPNVENYKELFQALRQSLKRFGITELLTTTTDDEQNKKKLFMDYENLLSKLLRKYRGKTPRQMMRKITDRGLGSHLTTSDWEISPILFQGVGD
jgi:hypothetical protein